MPKFSIVVPVYKVEPYISECVESVLKQTCTDLELILVDDGSPDRSGIICDEYAKQDSRIRVLHKKNGGVTAARGDGLRLATGEYVLFLDSDDYYTEDLLSKIEESIDVYAPEIVAFGYTRRFQNGSVIVKNQYDEGLYTGGRLDAAKKHLIYDKSLPSINYSGIIYGLSVKAIRREYLLQYWDQVPKEIKIGEDMAMTVLLIKHCSSLCFADHAGYCYRDNPQSATNSFSADDGADTRLLLAFLDANLGKEYMNNINVYCLNRCFNHLASAARQFESFGEYNKYAKSTYEGELYDRVCAAKVYLPTVRDRLKIFVMKHRMYRFLYKYYR